MAKKALGRGLNAIFEDVEESYNRELEYGKNSHDIVKELNVELIKPNPYQPRTHFDEKALKELSNSIKKHGLLQPIIVVQKDDEYMLLAGERRLRATKLAKLETIKAIVADIESKNLRELALIENIQREDLNPIELAYAYRELISEYEVTQDELSSIIHKSRTQITNTMRLLQLDTTTQKLISEGKLSQGHAKVIVGADKEQEQIIVDTVLGQKLSVRQTEDLVKRVKNEEKLPNKIPKIEKSLELKKVQKELEKFGIKTKLQKNSVVLDFKNNDEIDLFIEKLKHS